MNLLLNILLKFRAITMRFLFPSSRYWLATRSVKPLSRKFGFDRGTPIDRYWIESFLRENGKVITGKCLEVTDNHYTEKYGIGVVQSDVLDVDPENKKANIVADLRNMKNVRSNTYDCIILTHVLGLIDDYESAVKECKRILKKNGKILITVSCISPFYDPALNYWRFTPSAIRYIFSKYFPTHHIQIKTYGNCLTGQCFWVGMSQEDLTVEELRFNDPQYPCIVGAVITK